MSAGDSVDWQQCDDAAAFRWGYSQQDEVVAEWDAILRLRATADGRLVSLEPLGSATADLIRKTRDGSVAAFLRALRHQHSLHASAVSLRGRAVICVGQSRAGKSTIAERMCRHDGVELLADDLAAIEPMGPLWHVLPSESVCWLLTAEPVKMPTTPLAVARSPAPLRWIANLSFDNSLDSLELSVLDGAEAASAILGALARFDRSPDLHARELDVAASVRGQTRMLRVVRPHAVQPEAVADALLRVVEEAR